MAMRNLQELKRTQQHLLAEYRERRQQGHAAGSAATVADGAPLGIGRVSAVVEADDERGAHLLVVKQVFKGAPPAPCDLLSEAKVFYPTPGRNVADYAVDEYVLLLRTGGALVAAKLP